MKLDFQGKRREHGRHGRVPTDPLSRAMPMRTTERTDSHRRDACAPLQKFKSKELLA